MLAAFSVSWYCSIWKMLRTHKACGKSISFVLLIILGYSCGIGSKLMAYRDTGIWSPLIYLYFWNFVVTCFDAWLVVTLQAKAAISPGTIVTERAVSLSKTVQNTGILPQPLRADARPERQPAEGIR